jgi:hypothetical protein
MIKFSILITTRQRTEMLSNLLESIYKTTSNPSEVEIRIVYDLDDKETIDWINKKIPYEAVIVTWFHNRERSTNLVNDYHNWLAPQSQGKYIIFSNDDALFELNGWDIKTWEKLENFEKKYPDGIIYGIPEDFEKENRRNESNWMACFPLLSKKAIEVLGYAFDPAYIKDGADWALAGTYRKINRVVDLRECIVIKHLSFRSGRRKWDVLDENSLKLDSIINGNPPNINNIIEKNSKKLLEYINKKG